MDKLGIAIVLLFAVGAAPAHAKRCKCVRGAAVLEIQRNIGTGGARDAVQFPVFMQDGVMGPLTVMAVRLDQQLNAQWAAQSKGGAK